MIDHVESAASAVAERWGVEASVSPEAITIIVAAVVVLTAVPGVWRIARQASTIIHEMGHVLAALITGRRVSGIKLHSDTSGVTVSRGRAQGPGLLITFLAGYPAPGLLGLGLVWLGISGHSGAALTLYQVVLLLALMLSRNAVGILSCLFAVLSTGLIWWQNDPEIVGYTVVALGVFYALSGVRGALDLIRVHLRPRTRSSGVVAGTDASQAAQAWRVLPIPAAVWLFLFLVISVASAGGVVWMLFA
ncbi:M50 family metallopeptidase [Nesterenkonia haasae]|uniref:M50 family metallopeptidase n=1 Tax=Nesterenkonia haasae TaxID=2587813 RepID=UPI001390E25A|nr:M50 family metallopeptidase [Nesterenkonia haasae]